MEDDGTRAAGAELPGGYINPVVRIGDTVRRQPGPNPEFVRTLLRHLEACGFKAPRFLGIDDQGRDIFSYIEGHVAWEAEQPPGVWTDEALIEVSRLTRRFHDLTADTALAGNQEVVCHNDLSPRNTVYRSFDGLYRPVAFIDWDDTAPGERAADLAFSFWSYLHPCPRHANIGTHARRMHAMLDAYGFEGDRAKMIGRMVRRVQTVYDGIIELAATSAAHNRLIRLGALESISEGLDWLRDNQVALEEALE
ncbi:MAG: phosphotransferase [Dehalococcoidia bacterium]|nr:phosphotransferase [Dehalococcoidia bacterium]